MGRYRFEFVGGRNAAHTTLQADLPAFARPTSPARAVDRFQRCVATLFIRPTRGGSMRIGMRNALLPGILVHFVGFQDPVR